MKHEEIVYAIVKEFEPIRTEQVNIKGFYKGISESSRYLRYLQAEKNPRIKGEFIGNDKTKTWTIEKSIKYPQDVKYRKHEPLKVETGKEKLLTMATIRAGREKLKRIIGD